MVTVPADSLEARVGICCALGMGITIGGQNVRAE